MGYLRFGTGRKVVIMLPGLGDGLRSSHGLAPTTAILYRMYARDYSVYMFSRKAPSDQGALFHFMPAACPAACHR